MKRSISKVYDDEKIVEEEASSNDVVRHKQDNNDDDDDNKEEEEEENNADEDKKDSTVSATTTSRSNKTNDTTNSATTVKETITKEDNPEKSNEDTTSTQENDTNKDLIMEIENLRIIKIQRNATLIMKRAECMTLRARNMQRLASFIKVKATYMKNKVGVWKQSLWSVLPGSCYKVPPKLITYGEGATSQHRRNTTSSRLLDHNTLLNQQNHDFVLPDLLSVNERLDLGWKNKYSGLRTIISSCQGRLTYDNELDVKGYTIMALGDALEMCNNILRRKVQLLAGANDDAPESGATDVLNTHSPSDPVQLRYSHRPALFTNIHDHLLVYDGLTDYPLLYMENRVVWDDKSSNPVYKSDEVLDKFYNELSQMRMNGNPTPFIVLTCYDETCVYWLDNDASRAVIERHAKLGFEDERLDRIVSNLLQVQAGRSGDGGSQDQHNHLEDAGEGSSNVLNNAFIPHENCRVLRSARFDAQSLVAALLSALMCSLDGFQVSVRMKSLQLEQTYKLETLCMTETSFSWGILHTTYHGPKKKEGSSLPADAWYLLDHIGTSSTSRSYRALTLDGYDCVVKMYVKERDDYKRIVGSNAFDRNARKSVRKELETYRSIYGNELDDFMWIQELYGLQCLIQPYFHPIDESSRKDLVPLIIERLKLFLSNQKKIRFVYASDPLWHRMGWFNGKLYLFDLDDLEEYEDQSEAEGAFKRICKRLHSS